MKDYRGKNGERAILKFDASLVSLINDVLKQAIVEAQWAEAGWRQPRSKDPRDHRDTKRRPRPGCE